jgi:hypothetical protein
VGSDASHTRRKMPSNLSSSQGATQGVGKQDGVAIVDRRFEISIEGTLVLTMIAAVYADFQFSAQPSRILVADLTYSI